MLNPIITTRIAHHWTSSYGCLETVFPSLVIYHPAEWFLFIEVSHQNCLIVQLGAAAVNLVVGEKPADVYSGIATR